MLFFVWMFFSFFIISLFCLFIYLYVVCFVCLFYSGMHYATGHLFDMRAITEVAHKLVSGLFSAVHYVSHTYNVEIMELRILPPFGEHQCSCQKKI